MVQKVRRFDDFYKAWGVNGRYINEHRNSHKDLIEK